MSNDNTQDKAEPSPASSGYRGEVMVKDISNKDEYKRTMRLPLTFDVYARTDNYEEYEMVIVAASNEQAMVAADALCKKLGLILMACAIRD